MKKRNHSITRKVRSFQLQCRRMDLRHSPKKKKNSNSAVDTTSTFHILIGAFLNKGDNRYLVIVDIKRGI